MYKIMDILNELLDSRADEVDEWFVAKSKRTPPFFYNSVDLRYSGIKLAPVDTNLFPAGFNNLTEGEVKDAADLVRKFLHQYYGDVNNVLILAEDHTRNLYYLDNLVALETILKAAGVDVRITNVGVTTAGEKQVLESRSGVVVSLLPVVKKDGVLIASDDFVPEMVLLNHDMTGGVPDLLQGVSHHIMPSLKVGWHQRRKSVHFEIYNDIARDFAYKFNIDPWLISTFFEKCGLINFKEKKGIECVALRVDKTLGSIRNKYQQYGIEDEPYVFIKSDRGTYGMGIMTARSGDEVYEMGKNIRKKMNVIKGGVQNTEVIIQEGVPTIDLVSNDPAEPMVYMVGGEAVGYMYRFNNKRTGYENLNSAGMRFVGIEKNGKSGEKCRAYGIVSMLASYAAAWECYEECYNI